jgi:hypothetical protein
MDLLVAMMVGAFIVTKLSQLGNAEVHVIR